MKHKYHLRTWLEISNTAIEHNFRQIKKLISGQTKFLGVVKSNAYGHELFGFAQQLQKLGADMLGVDSITEGYALRKQNITLPILILGYTLPENFELAKKQRLAMTVSGFENLKILSRQKQPSHIHLKIDTGMHRQGFMLNDLPAALKIIKNSKTIKLLGAYTHLAGAKRADAAGDTKKQILNFEAAKSLVNEAGFKNIIFHCSATAGMLNYPETHYNMVRVGIGLYGLWPSEESKMRWKDTISLKPVLTWKTIISELKWVEKGAKIGYDYTETLRKRTLVAILPIGYWHGYWRAFSGCAEVLVKGKRCRVLGRVSMDMVAIDLTGINSPKVLNEAVLMGAQGKEQVSAEELAGLADTTNYEIVTKLNPLIKRIYAN